MARKAHGRRRKFNVAPPRDRTWRGKTYDSKMEMRFAQWLDTREDVYAWVEQPQILMGTDPCIRWRLDFLVESEDEPVHLVDVKGARTREFESKLRLFRTYGRMPLKIIQLKGEQWILLEEVVPESCR